MKHLVLAVQANFVILQNITWSRNGNVLPLKNIATFIIPASNVEDFSDLTSSGGPPPTEKPSAAGNLSLNETSYGGIYTILGISHQSVAYETIYFVGELGELNLLV